MEVKVSVIVPVYNGERYLVNCLSFLVNQTLKELEIIVVDDASTDNSRFIIEECIRQYPDKVKGIYLKENRGAGGARNIGLQEASGKYIGFVDCDDQVEPVMYEELYKAAVQGNYDIVDSYLYHEKESSVIITTPLEAEGKLDNEKRRLLLIHTGYIVSKIFKANLFQKGGIRFREKVSYEDPDFLCHTYMVAGSIICVKKVLYYYRYNNESTTKAINPFRYVAMEIEYMKALYERFNELDPDKKFREVLDFKLVYLYGKIMESYIYGDMDFGLEGLELLQKVALAYIGDMNNQTATERLDRNIYKLLLMNNQDPQKVVRIKELL